MTKKDFILIAETLHRGKPLKESNDYENELLTWSELCKDFAERLSAENSRFDIVKFIKYCNNGK